MARAAGDVGGDGGAGVLALIGQRAGIISAGSGAWGSRSHTLPSTVSRRPWTRTFVDIEIVEGGAGYTTKPVYPEAHLKTWKLKGWTDSGVENCEGSVLFGPHQVQVLKAQAAPRLFLASLRYQSPKGLPKDKIDEQAGPLLQRLKL